MLEKYCTLLRVLIRKTVRLWYHTWVVPVRKYVELKTHMVFVFDNNMVEHKR
jgi:hypothetical protein